MGAPSFEVIVEDRTLEEVALLTLEWFDQQARRNGKGEAAEGAEGDSDPASARRAD